jgi:transcriptional regulator with GAF, ATPase, and Fis domain/PAS domain-containing protein
MSEENAIASRFVDRPRPPAENRNSGQGGSSTLEDIISSSVDALSESGSWKSMLSSFCRNLARNRAETFAVFVVIGRDMKFRWTTYSEMNGNSEDVRYEDLLPPNADFGEAAKTISAEGSGIRLLREISEVTNIDEFTLYRGGEHRFPSLYMYVASRGGLNATEHLAFSMIAKAFASILTREFRSSEHISRSSRLAAAVEIMIQLHDGAITGSALNKVADILEKRLPVDFVAIMIEDENSHSIEMAGMSEALTPLYDTPQSLKMNNLSALVGSGTDSVILTEFEGANYKPLGAGSRWTCVIPLAINSKKRGFLVLESRTAAPFEDAEVDDIEVISRAIADRIAANIMIAEKDRKIGVRNMLLDELLLLQRENDPSKIADDALSFIDSVIHSNISVFYVLNQSRAMLIPIQSHGIFAEEMLSFSVRIGEGIVGRAMTRDKPELIHEAHTDARSVNIPGTPNEPESILAIPIRSIREDIGVIALHRIGRKSFSAEEIELAEITARHFSTVMERAYSTAELKQRIAEREMENHLRAQLAECISTCAGIDDAEQIHSAALQRAMEFCNSDNGLLFIRKMGEGTLTKLAGKGIIGDTALPELNAVEFDSLLKNAVRLPSGAYIMENLADISALAELVCPKGQERTFSHLSERALISESRDYSGSSAVFICFDYRSDIRTENFRSSVTRELLNFLSVQMVKLSSSEKSMRELERLKKLSGFKDIASGEGDIHSLHMKTAEYLEGALNAAFVAVYRIDYEDERLVLLHSSSHSHFPPKELSLKLMGGFMEKLNHSPGVATIELKDDTGSYPEFFRNSMAICRINSTEGADILFLAGFSESGVMAEQLPAFSESVRYLENRIRQLEASFRERQRSGILNLIGEVGRKISSERDFGRMLDALASAGGHLIGAEYALAGVISASFVEWNGYFETRIPESIDRLAVKSAERGEVIVINSFEKSQIELDSTSAETIKDMMIYPVFRKNESETPILLLLLNKFDRKGFTENDIWILEKLSGEVVNSVKNIETLRKETQLKRKAELLSSELSEILDEMEFPILRVDTAGSIEFANAYAQKLLLGETRSEGVKITSLLDEKDSLQIVELIDNLRKTERFDSSYSFMTHNGIRRMSVSGIPIQGKGRKKGTILMVKGEEAPPAPESDVNGAEQNYLSTRHSEIEGVRYTMRRGYSYIVNEQRSQLAYMALNDLSRAGFDILAITRQHPTRIREKFGLIGAEIRWLTQVVGSNNLDPSKLSMITSAMLNFIDRHANSALLIDGLEYLLSNNSVVKVVGMLESVMQRAVDRGAVIIASVDRLTFDQKDLAMIEKMFEELDLREMKRRYQNAEIEKFDTNKIEPTGDDAND